MQAKIVTISIDECSGNFSADLGPGLHGAECAKITEGFAVLGKITKDIWKQETGCTGNCGNCETGYYAEKSKLRMAQNASYSR